MNIIPITKEDWLPESQCFCFEQSDKNNPPITEVLFLHNVVTNHRMEFRFVKADIHNEEVAGWRYESVDGKYKLLIIND
jgi:hypothetical protein